MKIKLIISVTFLLLVSSNIGLCQISQIFKFSNVVYYKTSNLTENKLRGTSIGFFDGKIVNRYYDTNLKNDSLKICINGTNYLFKQNKRKEPKEYKEFVFYRDRPLVNDSIIMRSLKLIEIDSLYFTSEAKIVYRSSGLRKYVIVKIPVNEIDGVFLGTSENMRKSLFMGEVILGAIAIYLLIKSM